MIVFWIISFTIIFSNKISEFLPLFPENFKSLKIFELNSFQLVGFFSSLLLIISTILKLYGQGQLDNILLKSVEYEFYSEQLEPKSNILNSNNNSDFNRDVKILNED